MPTSGHPHDWHRRPRGRPVWKSARPAIPSPSPSSPTSGLDPRGFSSSQYVQPDHLPAGPPLPPRLALPPGLTPTQHPPGTRLDSCSCRSLRHPPASPACAAFQSAHLTPTGSAWGLRTMAWSRWTPPAPRIAWRAPGQGSSVRIRGAGGRAQGEGGRRAGHCGQRAQPHPPRPLTHATRVTRNGVPSPPSANPVPVGRELFGGERLCSL